jgi:uncharacterized HAD superfamily protein
MNSDYYKQRQEEKICIFDLDGVLMSCYPACWVNFVNEQLGMNYLTLTEVKKRVGYETYRELKRDYRTSGVKLTFPADEDAASVLHMLKSLGWKIIIITARPAQEFPCIAEHTRQWLEKNKLTYDLIEFGEKNKRAKILQEFPHVKFIVEDNSYLANQMAGWGYKVFLLNNIYNKDLPLNKNVERIYNLQEILISLQEAEYEASKNKV